MAAKTEIKAEIKTDKPINTKPKRTSKSSRIHNRRLKQESRKASGVTHA
ncbi:MAG: hypothetical protein WCE68_04035 [Anaerolineales bacterium]